MRKQGVCYSLEIDASRCSMIEQTINAEFGPGQPELKPSLPRLDAILVGERFEKLRCRSGGHVLVLSPGAAEALMVTAVIGGDSRLPWFRVIEICWPKNASSLCEPCISRSRLALAFGWAVRVRVDAGHEIAVAVRNAHDRRARER
jgi:hypothetical protein